MVLSPSRKRWYNGIGLYNTFKLGKDNFETELQNYLNENNITSQVKDVNPQNWNAIWKLHLHQSL